MRTPLGVFIFITLMFLLDTYVFQAIKTATQNASPKTKAIVYSIYWSVTILTILGFLIFVYTDNSFLSKKTRSYLFAIIIGLFLAKLTAFTFLLIDDIRRLVQWVIAKFIYKETEMDAMNSEGITRSVFLSWLGLAMGGGLFGSLVYGFGNKYRYQVKRIKLSFENLPVGFKGMRLLQISDIHSGSLIDVKAVQHGIDMILKENADLILFTGDLVNDVATEMAEFKNHFNRLKAPLGVYAVLGNHDYGDYIHWPYQGVTKEQNLENLKKIQTEMGWRLLMNEHVELERNGDKIALIGIENWSAKIRFPKHGRMDLAYTGAEKYPFKILMSHDPSHWEAQVIPQYSDIDLMLSGHTHGMQFGVDIPGFKWSPVQYVYKQWDGLYEKAKQKLYVNPGFGFIGYPGRVGVLPEITVIELV
jgi:predicted MPP superfamily phosphohydrolase